MKKKLAIITSHPIQYNAPWFSLLNKETNIKAKVFYTWSQTEHKNKFDPGFGRVVEWDIPLLEGYEYSFINNESSDPGTHHYRGIVNPTLIDEVEAWQPDAVLVFGWAFQSHLKCMRYFHKKKPVLFRGDSTLLDEVTGLKALLRRIFLKWVYSYIDYALYVGKNNKKYFLAHGLKEEQLVHVPHAIDNNRFADNDNAYSKKAKQMRLDLGFTDDDIVMLFAGKFERKKHPFFLVELLQQFNHPHVKVLFAGNGMLEKELKNAVKDDNRFVFLDFQNQQIMPVVYRVADLFILPSSGPGETWGLALNEAMACGKVVIASDKTGGAADLVNTSGSYSNGLIINNRKTGELIEFLKRVVNNKQLLASMGNNSKAVIAQFSFENIVTAIAGLVSRL